MSQSTNDHRPTAFDMLQGTKAPDTRRTVSAGAELRADIAKIGAEYPEGGSGDSPLVEALCRAVLNIEAELSYLKSYTIGLERRLHEAGVDFEFTEAADMP